MSEECGGSSEGSGDSKVSAIAQPVKIRMVCSSGEMKEECTLMYESVLRLTSRFVNTLEKLSLAKRCRMKDLVLEKGSYVAEPTVLHCAKGSARTDQLSEPNLNLPSRGLVLSSACLSGTDPSVQFGITSGA